VKRRYTGEMIDVTVCQQDMYHVEAVPLDLPEYLVDLESGIDYEGAVGVTAAYKVAVFAEERIGNRLDLELLTD